MDMFNGYPLGCNLPAAYPTAFPSITTVLAPMTLDQIKTEIAARGGSLWKNSWNRGQSTADAWIKDQGPYGSCNGYSTASALEKLRVARGLDYVELSGADAYSQMNGGSDNGSTLEDGLKVCLNGIAPASMVRQNQIYSSQISAAAKAERAKYKGFEPYAADTQEEFATGILNGFIGIIAVHVANGFDSLDTEGCPRSGNGVGNHSVHVDDLALSADGHVKFDSPNNWKLSWGNRGRCFYVWDRHLRETVRYHRFWLLRDTRDVPGGGPPVATE